MDATALEQARELLSRARRVVFLTGAGISTASGIPDYRGPDGVWTKNPTAEVNSYIDVWMRDAEIRKAGWQRRLNMSWDSVLPNPAHFAITKLNERGVLDLIVTQNIDGLHQRSGIPDERLVEIHGTVHDSVCMSCGHRAPIGLTLQRVEAGELDPACLEEVNGQTCGGIMKAATISFGQSLVVTDLERSQAAAANADLFVAAGSTLGVFPVAALVPLAHANDVPIIIMNGSATDMDHYATVLLTGDLTVTLPALCAD